MPKMKGIPIAASIVTVFSGKSFSCWTTNREQVCRGLMRSLNSGAAQFVSDCGGQ